MSGDHYGIDDAKRDLEHPLGAAPTNAVSGSWTATTLQAGTSGCQGRYLDAAGNGIADADDRWTQVYTAIGAARDKLEALGGLPRWNTLTIGPGPPASQ